MKRLSRTELKLILAVFAALVVLLVLRAVILSSPGDIVVVTVYDETVLSVPLSVDREIPIKAPDGRVTNRLSIRHGKAKMIEADCPDKLCMHQRAIAKDGEQIVCLPNRVVVRVISSEKGGLDGVTR